MHLVQKNKKALEALIIELTMLQAIKFKYVILMEMIKKILDKDGITAYPHNSNISFIKYFGDKDMPNSIEELIKMYKKFIEYVQL